MQNMTGRHGKEAAMNISVIKNEAQYKTAMQALESLMDRDPQPGSDDADRLELLGLLLEVYENKHVDIGLPDPVEAIRFRMEQQELKQRDLVPYIGSANRVSEILSRKRPLTVSMIRSLNKGLGIPAEVLIQEPGAEIPDDLGIDWLKFPINEMFKREWFGKFKGTMQEAKAQAEELMGSLLQVIDHKKAPQALYRQADHIRSGRDMNRFALLAWQARILQKAEEEAVSTEYQPGTVCKEFMQDLVKLSWADEGPQLARQFLNRHGIHLVIEPHLKKTYLDGAAMCLKDGTPVVALTLRYDRLDNFWFTLMHELSHVALHFNGECVPYFDDLDDKQPKERVEREADELAAEVLLPEDIWQASDARLTKAADDIFSLANQLNIHPAIIAGRIRYETGDYRNRIMAKLVGSKMVKIQLIN